MTAGSPRPDRLAAVKRVKLSGRNLNRRDLRALKRLLIAGFLAGIEAEAAAEFGPFVEGWQKFGAENNSTSGTKNVT